MPVEGSNARRAPFSRCRIRTSARCSTSAAEELEYLVMEYLAGETLARLGPGPNSLAEAVITADQIASALVAAHRAGIVHRDLKPGNVMLTETGVRLLDFGLARHSDVPANDSPTAAVSDPITTTGTITGTLPYMAPEQIEGRAIDPRTDIFAFGAVLYETLTGRRAFDAPTQAALIGRILHDDPPPLRTVDSKMPPALDRIVRRCLEKHPDARWQSAAEIQTALAAMHTRRRHWLPFAAGLLGTAAAHIAISGRVSTGTRSVPTVTGIRRVTH